MFEMCEKNSSRQASVRERYFHLGARDRKVVREPESGGRALLPCPMAHATRHARAVSRARATAARTPKSFPALTRCVFANATLALPLSLVSARPRGRSRTGVEVTCSPAVSDDACEAACACRITRVRHSSANSEVVSGTGKPALLRGLRRGGCSCRRST